ncbi:hypothetical protein GCM10009733_057780 [Nonomuraea maheshkhaliensis]|uniref:Protein kinase domain-containing protein n=1 Tax=Nonomuraea maheshkhaliensis TaxID=419590 RepID=A0ABN2FLZ7_9ACTN
MNSLLWPEPLRPGDPRQAGAYRLEGRLGGGGMGQVFLGRSPGGRPVAVKLVRPDLADDPGFRRRFALEAEAARRVGGFYTAQLIDADPDADPPWLVTAYIPGPSLHQAVEAHGPMPAGAITVLGAGLAEGLGAIHACDLVHRDLKPSNVILAGDGPRVIDFGITRALDATSHTLSRAVIGTPSFMSPEQARGREIGPPSDVFSLGLVLAFAATGRSPFGTGQAEAIVYRVAHDEPDLAGLPAHLTDLVKRCLAKDPGDRPSVAGILGELTDPALTTTPWLPPPIESMIDERHVQTRPAPSPSSDPGPHKGGTRVDPDHDRALDTPGDMEHHPHEPGHREPSGSGMFTNRRRPTRRLLLLGGLAALGAAAVPIGWNFWSHRNRLTDRDLHTVAFSPDGRTIAGGNIHGDGWLWATDSHEVIADFSSEDSGSGAMAFTPDGSALVTTAMKVPLHFRNPSTGRVTHSLSSPVGGAHTMVFSADGTRLVVAGNIPVGNPEASEICVVWDVAAKEQKHKLPFATKASSHVNSAAFIDGGDSILLAGTDLTEADGTDGFWRWNLDSGDLKPIGPDGSGSAVAVSPNGKQYALGGAHGCSLTAGDGTGLHIISNAEVDALAFSPDGATLAVADKDGIRLWDAAAGRAKATVTDRRAAALAFHPDGTFLVSGGWFVDAEGCWVWPVEDT